MLTNRVKGVEYAIREIAAVAQEVAKKGKKIYHLNIGDPVIYDFQTPEFISDALSKYSRRGKNNYVNSLGVIELREEISKNLKRQNLNVSTDELVVTSGVTEGINLVISSIIENGKELLIPGPSYPLYINYTKFYDGKPVEYILDEQQDWEPNIEDLRKKITKKTQAILICSPNNPTGVLYGEKKIKEIMNLAGEYNLPILSDEIYDQITYEKPYVCPASLAKDVPVIGLNGFSKTHLVTGWRLGYLYYHDPENKLEELKNGIAKLARARLSSSSVAQFAAIDILRTPSNHTVDMVRKLKERRDYSYDRLCKIEGITCVKPNGAFYLFPKLNLEELKKWKDDKELVVDLLKETGVCLVYGSGFGSYGKGHMRLTFLPELKILEKVYNLIEEFLK